MEDIIKYNKKKMNNINKLFKILICKTKFHPLRDLQLQFKSYSNRFVILNKLRTIFVKFRVLNIKLMCVK